MHLFHCPDLSTAVVELPREEAHHAIRVLRLAVGDRIGMLDGKGTRAEGIVQLVNKSQCSVAIEQRETVDVERSARIHIAVALTKQMDRLEWFVEKAVEVGVDRITLLLTSRNERKTVRLDRLERVAVAAMKQSQRVWLPRIDPPVTLSELLEQELPKQRFFGWCEGEHDTLMQRYSPSFDALLVIGPEGDFTQEEAEQLMASGFLPVSLGNARLRTETAALTACMWMSLCQQA